MSFLNGRPRGFGLREFVALELPGQKFLVEPFFPTGGTLFLYAKRASLKTQLALTLAEAVTAGEPFLGRFPTTKSRVAYLSVDMGVWLVQDRLRAAFPAFREPDAFHLEISHHSVDVVRASAREDWVQDINGFAPHVIMADVLSCVHSLPENEAATTTSVLAAFRRLFDEDVALVLLHHDRKSSIADAVDPAESFRGTGNWLDKADVGFKLTKGQNFAGQQLVTLTFSKVRTCKDLDPITLALDPETLLLSPAEVQGPAPVARARALELHVQDPTLRAPELARLLISEGYGQSNAYKIAKEVLERELK